METRTQRDSAVSKWVALPAVPKSVRPHTTIAEPDYVDLFTLTTPRAQTYSAEEWTRTVLEAAPLARRSARALWRVIGLRLGPNGSPEHVQGWRIAAGGDGWLRLETASWYLTAQAVCLLEEDSVSLSLVLHYDRSPVAELVWAFVAGPHQRAVPVMLRQADEILKAAAG